MRDNVENQNKHRNNGRHQNTAMSQALLKVGVTPSIIERSDKHIEEQANYAIASNLAYSQLVQLLGCKDTRQVGQELEKLGSEINTLSALIMYRRECAESEQEVDAKKIQDFNATLTKFNTHTAGFEKLWARIMRPLSEERRPYFSADERKLLMCELMCLCERLRNRFSHWIPLANKRAQVLQLTGKPQFSAFLEFLYTQATSRLSLPQWFELVVKADATDQEKIQFGLDEKYSPAFIFSLFNTRSQMQRLTQGLRLRIPIPNKPRQERPLKRRENQLYQFYARRDGYSETQLDPHSALLREMMGYLNLPPLQSAAGKAAKAAWDEKQKTLNQANAANDASEDQSTPQFRRASKHIYYALQTLDTLQLLPEWTFTGHTQQLSEGDGDEDDAWDGIARAEDDIPSKHGHAQRSKLGMATQYGRNLKLPANQRFVYDLRDPNLRFQLTVNGKKVTGVIRERDFCNLVYFALTKRQDAQTITNFAHHWLEKYQQSLLQTESSWAEKLQSNAELQVKNYPRQIQWKIQNTVPDLYDRLKASAAARIDRLKKIDARCILPKRDANGLKEKRSEHDLPRHEKIHELLHIFIRHLNAEGRSTVTQREYSRLQQLLLNYKGADMSDEIKSIKAEVVDADVQHERVYSYKAMFWHHLHHTYTPDLVNAGHVDKTHPIWVHSQVEGKFRGIDGKERKKINIPGLDKLFKLVLEDEIRNLQSLEKHLHNSKENPTELQQIAFRLQVSLMDERHVVDKNAATTEAAGNKDEVPKYGYGKSCHDALQYSVLPASICQQALGMEYKEEISLSKDKKEYRFPSIATLIREHHCERSLIAAFYEPSLVMPKAYRQLQANGKLSCLAKEDKVEWKKCVQALNDWHTEDKLCLLMIGQLAQPAQMQFGTGSVADFYSQPVKREVSGVDHLGQARRVTLRLSNSLQATRLWFAWPLDKLERALCWHSQPGAEVDAAILQQIVIAYQTRTKKVVEQVLMLEKSVFERFQNIKNRELVDEVGKNGYVPFKTILSKSKNWDSKHNEAMIQLRNKSLHDGLPEQDLVLQLYPDSVRHAPTLDVQRLGEPQMQQIKNGIQANRN